MFPRRIAGIAGSSIAGGLVAFQGIANRHFGAALHGSYQHAGFVSLFNSSAMFLAWALIRRLLKPLYARLGINYEPLNMCALVGKDVPLRTKIEFFCSGVPGAGFVVVFATAIDMASSAVAGPVGIAGILAYPVFLNRKAVDKGRRYVLIGALTIASAMFLISVGTLGNLENISFWAWVWVAVSFPLGVGVGWQLITIKKMRVASSSGLSASIMSSLSGLTTQGATVAIMALFPAWSLLPSAPLPPLFGETWIAWMGGLAGFGLIYIGAFAASAQAKEYGEKLGPAVHLSVLGLGLLAVSFAFGFSLSNPLPVVLSQAIGLVGTVVGIGLCVFKIGKLLQEQSTPTN